MTERWFCAILLVLTLLTMSVHTKSQASCLAPGSQPFGENPSASSIIWEPAIIKESQTIIPASADASFGRFSFQWVIASDKTAKLVMLERLGAGELPPVETKLFILNKPNDLTIIFKQWNPLLNDIRPPHLQAVVTVKTSELYQPLADVTIPHIREITNQPMALNWEKAYDKKGTKYVSGYIPADFGRLTVLWKIPPKEVPSLITISHPSGGERPLVESQLHLVHDEPTGITIICQEHHPLLNQGGSSYLWPLAIVGTTDLLHGLSLVKN